MNHAITHTLIGLAIMLPFAVLGYPWTGAIVASAFYGSARSLPVLHSRKDSQRAIRPRRMDSRNDNNSNHCRATVMVAKLKIPMKLLRNIVKRTKLPDTPIGKILQAVGVISGFGAVATTSFGYFELTGDQYTDIAIILATTAIILFGGKLPIPTECEKELD
jgi:hypothetical protein